MTTISILAEIPESLHQSIQQHLDQHPDWDSDRLMTAALALFLLQQGERQIAATYLDSLFGRTEP
jgi:Protein of unknown function (DUF2811)